MSRSPARSVGVLPVGSASAEMAFHSLHATSQALQPMHTEVSVKKPSRGGRSPGMPR
jgi:hypothetical protein